MNDRERCDANGVECRNSQSRNGVGSIMKWPYYLVRPLHPPISSPSVQSKRNSHVSPVLQSNSPTTSLFPHKPQITTSTNPHCPNSWALTLQPQHNTHPSPSLLPPLHQRLHTLPRHRNTSPQTHQHHHQLRRPDSRPLPFLLAQAQYDRLYAQLGRCSSST